jgi:hypothetical protein
MEPKTFSFDKSPAPAAVETLVHEMAGYDFVLVNYSGGDQRAVSLSRFFENMPRSGTILSMTFRQRGAGK